MKFLLLIAMVLTMFGCSHTQKNPIPRAENVDIDRFMGRWYVIANIPTFIETEAHNAVETYTKNPDGTIDTVFTFHDESFDGDFKRYNPKGFVSEEDNALWGMQFIWPIKAEFIIAHVDAAYQNTIIARTARDYLWIMARTPQVDEQTYQSLIELSENMGYDINKIRKVPQQWPASDMQKETP